MPVRLRIRLPGRRRRPTDARVDRTWPSDARPAGERRPGAAPDPEAERARRLRVAALALFLVLVFVGSSLAAVFGDAGLLDIRHRRREIADLSADVARRKAGVAALEAHVRRLESDPRAIERIAREDLGLTRPGEITFLLPKERVQETRPRGAPPAPPSDSRPAEP